MTMMRRLLARYASPESSMRLLLTVCQVREGFIIDDEDEEPEERERRRRKDKKRRRAEREEEEAVLDEEDLDLIGEANPEWERKTAAQVC
jgi:Acidic N-terminal SPT6